MREYSCFKVLSKRNTATDRPLRCKLLLDKGLRPSRSAPRMPEARALPCRHLGKFDVFGAMGAQVDGDLEQDEGREGGPVLAR